MMKLIERGFIKAIHSPFLWSTFNPAVDSELVHTVDTVGAHIRPPKRQDMYSLSVEMSSCFGLT